MLTDLPKKDFALARAGGWLRAFRSAKPVCKDGFALLSRNEPLANRRLGALARITSIFLV